MQLDNHPERHRCYWCGATASKYVLTHRAVIRKSKEKEIVIATEDYAPVCNFHWMSLERTREPASARGSAGATAKAWKGKQEKLC